MSNKKFDFGKILVAIVTIIAFVAILMISGALSGCEQRKNVGKDGYYFEEATFVHTQVPVTIVLAESPEALFKLKNEVGAGANLPPDRTVMAFSALRSDGSCTIYMLDPRVADYEPEWIGHEFTHCVFGEWHKIQP